MKSKITSVQFFTEDMSKINTLAESLSKELGSKVGKRVAVMIAVNKMLKEKQIEQIRIGIS